MQHTSSSAELPSQHEGNGGSHDLHDELPAEATVQPSSSSPIVPSPTKNSAHQNLVAPFGDAMSSSQSPFPDASGSHTPPASAAVGAWDPWAEDLIHKSPSSPHYQPGSSDSDWDDPDPSLHHPEPPLHDPDLALHSHADGPDSAQHYSPPPSIAGQDNSHELPSSTPQPSSPDPNPVASAMAEAQHRLDQLVGLAASHTEVQDTLSQGSDLGYAWELMASYTEHLQRQIRTDPAALPKFNALVFKLRSVMAPALAALTPLGLGDPQAGAAEVVTYFTGGLLTLTQRVVPVLFFNTLEAVCAIHEAHSLTLPSRLEQAQLRDCAHFPQRAELAQLTQRMAAYAGHLQAFDR
ncbi:hypothetical protein ABBQ38_014130 [Trebouxia sp. C0009 RCD-2024]